MVLEETLVLSLLHLDVALRRQGGTQLQVNRQQFMEVGNKASVQGKSPAQETKQLVLRSARQGMHAAQPGTPPAYQVQQACQVMQATLQHVQSILQLRSSHGTTAPPQLHLHMANYFFKKQMPLQSCHTSLMPWRQLPA
jgi:hypothetical protein